MSAVALLKIISHADATEQKEVGGLVKGYNNKDTFVILDTLPFPTGIQFADSMIGQAEGDLDHIVGWYKSHPDYGLYLGGIEREQDALFPEPRVAIIVDPVRTCSAGKVSIAAFRSYSVGDSRAYYSLKLSFFKSALDIKLLDLFWNKYWGSRLAESDLLMNNRFAGEKIEKIAYLTEEAENSVDQNIYPNLNVKQSTTNNNENNSWKVTERSTETSVEQINGILAESVKLLMFSSHFNAEK
jgi:COP9 signalosome complex subunit 5